MNDERVLMEEHEEERQAILSLEDKTPPAIILNLFGRWFSKSISKQSLFYWILQIFLINAVFIFPAFLLSLALDETETWSGLSISWFAAPELVIFGLIQAHILFRWAFHELANHIVHKIINLEDRLALVSFCKSSASSMYTFLIIGGIFWPIWTFFALKEFPGVGLFYMVILTGILMGISLQAVVWVITLVNCLKRFQYELNTFMPANSEVVTRLTNMLNKTTYLTGSFFIVVTLLISSGLLGLQVNKTQGVPITLLGWTIIIVQFLFNHSAINVIVDRERWTNLNKLQYQMNTIQATEDLSNKDVSERLLRLADLHERIRVDRSGGFDFKSLLSLFSQLMLPLLGLLLGNMDKLMELFK